MTNISKILIREGLLRAGNLDDKLSAVARAVSVDLDTRPEGVLYEIEVARAISELQKRKSKFLKLTDAERLAKPRLNLFYESQGVKSLGLQEAIELSLQKPTSGAIIEVEYNYPDVGSPQALYNRVVFYKQDEKLREYIQSRLSGPVCTKVVYAFSAPDNLLTVRNGLIQRERTKESAQKLI